MLDSRTFLTFAILAYTIALFGSQALMSLGFALCLLAIGVRAWRGPELSASVRRLLDSLWGSRYAKVTLLLLLAFFLSVLGARLFPVDIGGIQPRARWGTSLAKSIYFIWPLLFSAALLTLNERDWKRLQSAWVGAFAVVSIFGLIELTTGWNPRSFFEQRAHASFGGLYTVNWIFGSYLTYASVMVFPFFFLLDRARNQEWLVGPKTHGLILVIGGIALMGTMSRMLWIALPIGLTAYLIIRLRGAARWGAIAAIALTLAASSLLPPIRERLQYARGFEQRTQLWKINWEFFRMRPLTGVGWHENLPLAGAYFNTHLPQSKERFVGHAHSNILEFLGAMGLLGLVAWICWSVVTAALVLSVFPALFCAFIVFHLNGLTQVNFSETKTLHTVVWSIAMSLAMAVRRKPEKEPADGHQISDSEIFEWDVANWSRALPFWRTALTFGQGQKALAIGERNGGLSLWLASLGFRTISSDLNGVTSEARNRHERHGLAHLIQYENADTTKLPFPNETFDIVAFKSVLGALQSENRQKESLQEIYRVLRPGGVLLFAENLQGSKLHQLFRRRFTRWSAYWRYPSLDELRQWLHGRGDLMLRSYGVLGAFGRTEPQRWALGFLDRWISPAVSESSRYIVFGTLKRNR